MASVLLSSIMGKGGLPKLAPHLTYPSSIANNAGYTIISGINATGSLTTALSLVGKFAIDLLLLDNMTSENVTLKLTVDGVVIWNDTFTLGGTNFRLFGSKITTGTDIASTMQCDLSLLLEIQTTTDTNINLSYVARPII